MQILTNLLLDYIIFVYSSWLQNFRDNKKLIAMSSINCLNSNFCSLKLYIKNEFINRMENYIQFTWKLACILRTYKTFNSTVGFLKYEFYNKLLGNVTLIELHQV